MRFGRPNDVSDAAVRLSHDRYYPVCRPGYRNGQPDWREAPLFDSSGVTESWESWLAAQGLALPAHQRVHLGSTYVVSVHAALHGAGLAMAHDTIAADLVASGALVRPYAHGAVMSQAYFLLAPPSPWGDPGEPRPEGVDPGRDRRQRDSGRAGIPLPGTPLPGAPRAGTRRGGGAT